MMNVQSQTETEREREREREKIGAEGGWRSLCEAPINPVTRSTMVPSTMPSWSASAQPTAYYLALQAATCAACSASDALFDTHSVHP